MIRSEVFDYARREYGTEPDYPWGDNSAVLRHKSGKWYGLVMRVGRDKLGLPGEGAVDALNVKCDPMLIGGLLREDGYHKAYHMNKERWITIRLDGSVSEEDIRSLIDLSFSLTDK